MTNHELLGLFNLYISQNTKDSTLVDTINRELERRNLALEFNGTPLYNFMLQLQEYIVKTCPTYRVGTICQSWTKHLWDGIVSIYSCEFAYDKDFSSDDIILELNHVKGDIILHIKYITDPYGFRRTDTEKQNFTRVDFSNTDLVNRIIIEIADKLIKVKSSSALTREFGEKLESLKE